MSCEVVVFILNSVYPVAVFTVRFLFYFINALSKYNVCISYEIIEGQSETLKAVAQDVKS